MLRHPFLTLSEVSKIVGVPRRTLLFYADVGLLPPARVAPNGYRFYTQAHLVRIGVILSLAELGLSLKEIKARLDRLTPASSRDLLRHQCEVLDARIERLRNLRDTADLRLAQLDEASRARGLPGPRIVEQPKPIPLLLSEVGSQEKADYPNRPLTDFYNACAAKGLAYGAPLGWVVPLEEVRKGLTERYTHAFIRVRTRTRANAVLPAGRYVCCYVPDCNREGAIASAYAAMLRHCEAHGETLVGDAYEEYLVDEVCSANPKDWLAKLSIRLD